MTITFLSDSDNIDSIQLQEQATAPATPASGYGRIYCKSDGLYFIGDNGTEIGPLGAGGGAATNLASAVYTRKTGTYSTTSATFVDVDSTNTNLTINTGARRVLISFMGECYVSASSSIYFDVELDGVRLGGSNGLCYKNPGTGESPYNWQFTTDPLSAGSHTFKLQWRVSDGQTGYIYLGNNIAQFAVVELLAGA